MPDHDDLMDAEFAWAVKLGHEIRDADQAKASAERLQRKRANAIAAAMPGLWKSIKFAADEAAKRLGDQFHFESVPDDPDTFVVQRASAANLSAKVNGESITMISTRMGSSGKLQSDPPMRFTVHHDPNNDQISLKLLGEKLTVFEALERMLRATFLSG